MIWVRQSLPARFASKLRMAIKFLENSFMKRSRGFKKQLSWTWFALKIFISSKYFLHITSGVEHTRFCLIVSITNHKNDTFATEK